jgi:hypothetical protein
MCTLFVIGIMRENFVGPLSSFNNFSLLNVFDVDIFILGFDYVLLSNLLHNYVVIFIEILLTHHRLQKVALIRIANKLGVETPLNIIYKLIHWCFDLLNFDFFTRKLDRIIREPNAYSIRFGNFFNFISLFKDKLSHLFIEKDRFLIFRGHRVKLFNKFFCQINIIRLPNITNISILRVEINACLLPNRISGIHIVLELFFFKKWEDIFDYLILL